jgi:hypothetical protein
MRGCIGRSERTRTDRYRHGAVATQSVAPSSDFLSLSAEGFGKLDHH